LKVGPGKTYTLSSALPSPGVYNASLKITDDDGGNSSLPVQFTVGDTPGVSRAVGAAYAITGGVKPTAAKTLTVTAGVVSFTADLGPTFSNLSVAVGAGKTLVINSTQHLAGLTLSGGTTATISAAAKNTPRHLLVLGALSIDATSKLDITNNEMIVRSAGIAPIESLLLRGSNNGDWKGTGLTSSTAANDKTFNTAVGAAAAQDIAATTFDGETVSGADVLVKYTYYGDADLSGTVTGDDESLTLFGLRQGGAPHWAFGDFDYSGHVNGDDYSLFLAGLKKPPLV
jgi:hypothetical protein